MAQQLNLYDPSLRPPRVWVTPGRVLLAALLVAAAVAGAAWQVRGQAQAALARSAALQTQLQQLGGAPSANADEETAQRKEIEALRWRVQALQALAQAQAKEPDGRAAAAAWLEALAQAAPGDVWLTAMQWQAPHGGEAATMALEGEMLDPRRLPVYLRRLEAQPALQGQRLAQVQVEPAPVVVGREAQPAKPAQFVLRSQPKANVR